MSDRHPQLLYRLTHALSADVGALPDAELLLRLTHGGDRAAFELLLWRHGPMVWGVCRRVLGHCQDAEDVFQATFLTLARKSGTIGDGTSLAGWLYRVAFRAALAARKARQRRTGRELLAADMPETSAADDPARAACGRETGRLLDEEIARLPDRYRLPFILCELQGRGREVVAAELNCAVGTVDSRLSRARERLRTRLERRGVALSAGLGAVAVPANLRAQALEAALAVAAEPAPATLGLSAMILRPRMVMVAGLLAACVIAVALVPGERPEPGVQAPEVLAPEAPRGPSLPREAVARVGAARLRHADRVRSVAYSPDGRWLVSAGTDGLVNVWDAATGALQQRITILAGRPPAANELLATFSGDGKEIVVLGPKKDTFHLHLRRFDLDTGQEQAATVIGRADTQEQIDERRGLTLAADGSVFGVKVGKREYRLWDAGAGKVRQSFTLPPGWNERPVLAPAGNLVAFLEPRASDLDEFKKGARVKILDVRTGKELREIREPQRQIATAALTPDGNTLATITYQLGFKHELAFWDLPTGRLLRRVPGIERSANCAVFSQDGKRLAIGTDHGRHVQVFATDTGAAAGRFSSPLRLARLAFTPDGGQLAAASEEGVVLVWDLATGTPAAASADPAATPFRLRFTDDSHLLVMGGGVSVRDWRSGKIVRRLAETFEVRDGRTFVLSPDLHLAAMSEGDGTIHLVEAATGKPVRELHGHTGYTQALQFSGDGGRVFARSLTDPQLRSWDVATGKELPQLPLGREQHGWDEIALSADGKLLATLTWDPPEVPLVRLWDTATGRLLHLLRPTGTALRLAFSPDGTLLACCGGDAERPFNEAGRVTLWDTATGQPRGTLVGHTTAIYCLHFAPDSRTLATGGYDGTVRLWEIAAAQERHVFQGHAGYVFCLAYAGSGRWLASASREAPVFVWDIYGSAPRGNLTDAERRQLWDDLAAPEAPKAFRAIRRLFAAPDDAVALCRANLKPRPVPDEARLRQLLDDLGSDRFDVRQRATTELQRVADSLGPTLRRALDETKALEVRQRLERLLAIAEAPLPERLRELRALEVLEQAGALPLLDELARGPATARLTAAAAAARSRQQR